jgi:hypothetical protein
VHTLYANKYSLSCIVAISILKEVVVTVRIRLSTYPRPYHAFDAGLSIVHTVPRFVCRRAVLSSLHRSKHDMVSTNCKSLAYLNKRPEYLCQSSQSNTSLVRLTTLRTVQLATLWKPCVRFPVHTDPRHWATKIPLTGVELAKLAVGQLEISILPE